MTLTSVSEVSIVFESCESSGIAVRISNASFGYRTPDIRTPRPLESTQVSTRLGDGGTAREIRAAYAAGGASQQMLAERYGVGQTMISRVILGKAWSDTDTAGSPA